MIRPFKRVPSYFLLLLILLGTATAVQAQQKGDNLGAVLKEAKDAGVSETTLNRLLALGYEKQVEPSAMGNLLSILAQCQRENLPMRPFLSKIEEGLSKRVSAARIEMVLKNRLEDYRFTRSLIDQFMKRHGTVEPVAPEYHVRLTETLYCGVSRKDLEELVSQFPHASLPMVTRGAEVLASLKQMQFDPKLSEQIVDTAIKQGFFTAEQRNFSRIIALAKQKGIRDDQIATITLKVIENRESQSDFSSQLGINAQDLDRRGPQLRSSSPGLGSPEDKNGVGEPGRGSRGDPGPARREQAGMGSGSSGKQADPGRGSGARHGSSEVGPTGGSPNSGGSGGSGGGGGKQAAAGGGSNDSPGSGKAGPTSSSSNDSPGKGEAAPSVGSGDDPVKGEAGPTSSGSGDGNSSADRGDAAHDGISKEVDETEQQQQIEGVRFAAAGKVAHIDAKDLTLMLEIEKANPVLGGRIGETVPFAISDKVKVKTEVSEPGVFELGLDDIKAEADYLRVLGKELASGTFLITHIVVCWEEEESQPKAERETFTAAGKVTQFNAADSAVTLEIEKANPVLSGRIGETVLFVISENVKVKIEGSEPGALEPSLSGLKAQGGRIRVLGKELASETFLITHIVVCGEEREPQQEAEGVTFSATGKVAQIDATDLSMTLEIERTNRILNGRMGDSTPFVISENVTVKAEGSETGTFDLGLDDLDAEGDYLMILGKKLTDGTLLITHIVIYLDK